MNQSGFNSRSESASSQYRPLIDLSRVSEYPRKNCSGRVILLGVLLGVLLCTLS